MSTRPESKASTSRLGWSVAGPTSKQAVSPCEQCCLASRFCCGERNQHLSGDNAPAAFEDCLRDPKPGVYTVSTSYPAFEVGSAGHDTGLYTGSAKREGELYKMVIARRTRLFRIRKPDILLRCSTSELEVERVPEFHLDSMFDVYI